MVVSWAAAVLYDILFSYLLFIYLLTYSLQQSPSWEANRFSANQVIPRILWNPKVHYRFYKCSLPVPILSQLNPLYDIIALNFKFKHK